MIHMAARGILEREHSALIVIDVQERFKPVISRWDETVANISKLIMGCKALHVPVLATEQYPKGLGRTVPEISGLLDSPPMEKITFSCLGDGKVREKVRGLGRRQLLLCGIEAHVCVLNTALDAISEGYEVHYVADAISSRKQQDMEIAVERVTQSGAYLASTEMALFQLLKTAGSEEFKEISRIVK
jgi:nicotinamidase-related amidase